MCDAMPGCVTQRCLPECSFADAEGEAGCYNLEGCYWEWDWENGGGMCKPECWRPDSDCGESNIVVPGCPFEDSASPCEHPDCTDGVFDSACRDAVQDYCMAFPADTGCSPELLAFFARTPDECPPDTIFQGVCVDYPTGLKGTCSMLDGNTCQATPGCRRRDSQSCEAVRTGLDEPYCWDISPEDCGNYPRCAFDEFGNCKQPDCYLYDSDPMACDAQPGCRTKEYVWCESSCKEFNSLDECELSDCAWIPCATDCSLLSEDQCHGSQECDWMYNELSLDYSGPDTYICTPQCWRNDASPVNCGQDCPWESESALNPCNEENPCDDEVTCVADARALCEAEPFDPGCNNVWAIGRFLAEGPEDCPPETLWNGICHDSDGETYFDGRSPDCYTKDSRESCLLEPACSYYEDPGSGYFWCYQDCSNLDTHEACADTLGCSFAGCVYEDCSQFDSDPEACFVAKDLGCELQRVWVNNQPELKCFAQDWRLDNCFDCPFEQCPPTVDNPCHPNNPCNSDRTNGQDLSPACILVRRAFFPLFSSLPAIASSCSLW